MKFIENLYGNCLFNFSEIVSIYKVGCYSTHFPYQHTIHDFKEIGIYAAIKIGKNCYSLPLVTGVGVAACAHCELNDSEIDRYLDFLKATDEKDSILTEIMHELRRQIKISSCYVDIWDAVLTSIRRHYNQLSGLSDDEQSDD